MTRIDPLKIAADLPLRKTYHPLGFRLDVAANSNHVLEAADESWGSQRQEFPCEVMEFRVIVQPEGPLCGMVEHRAHGSLYSVVSDMHNFAALDLHALKASIFVSQRTAEEHAWLRWFFVESLAYTLLAQRYVAPVHAACVAREGRGVLLSGPSAAGKSTLSYACARAGWQYVSDDCAFLLPGSVDSIAIGRCERIRLRPDAPAIFPELSGLAAHARPNGRLAIEVPMASFSGIQTTPQVSIGAVVFLERQPGAAGLKSISEEQAITRLLADMPSYGPEVNAMHEDAVRRVARRAFLMQYQSIEDGLELLRQVE